MSGKRGEKEAVLDLFNVRGEDKIQKHQTQKELLDVIEKKKAEISILHQVNTRLGAELSLLQRKLGIDHDVILQELDNINEISVAFHFQLEQLQYLDHLLMAYDETNIKQKKLIAYLYSELEDANKKTETLAKDNEFLMEEMQSKCKQILQIYSKGFPDDNLVSMYSKLQRETEAEIIENIREENQYLLRNFNELQDRYKKLEKEFKETKKSNEAYYQKYKQQSQQLTESLIRVDDLSKIKQILEKKFDETTQENLQLETIRDQLQNRVNKLEQDYKSLRNQSQQQKTNNREDIQKMTEGMDTLKAENQTIQKRQRQFFNKNMILQRELQTLKDENRSLKRDLEKLKSDFQQTLKMCQAYESKINNYTRKEEYMRNIVDQSKEKLDSALLERDKAILKQQQLEKFIDNMTFKNRQEMETLKSTFEKIINSQNEKMKVLQENRDEYQSSYHQQQHSLKLQLDKLKKENSILREQNQKFIQNVRNNSGSQIISKLNELEQRNDSLNRRLIEKETSSRNELDHKDEIIRSLQNSNRELSFQIDKQRASSRQFANERTHLKSKFSIIQKEKQCLQDENMRLKRSLDSRSHTRNEDYEWKIKELKEKLDEAVEKQKQTRVKAIEMLEKYDRTEEELKLQYIKRINELEGQNSKLKRKLAKK